MNGISVIIKRAFDDHKHIRIWWGTSDRRMYCAQSDRATVNNTGIMLEHYLEVMDTGNPDSPPQTYETVEHPLFILFSGIVAIEPAKAPRKSKWKQRRLNGRR